MLDKNFALVASVDNKKVILLVDDEKDVLNLFYEYLHNFGYKTISFDNPLEALRYLEDNNVSNCSLIITDYKMPQMNGIDLIKKIREKYGSNLQVKIMLVSAFMKNELHVQNILNNLKIDKIIEKPIRLEILKDEIKKLIN